MVSEKGKDLFILDGDIFRFHKLLKNDVQRWPCVKKSCKAFLKLNPSKEIVEKNSNHTHQPEKEHVLNRPILNNSFERKAVGDIFLLVEALKGVQIDVYIKMRNIGKRRKEILEKEYLNTLCMGKYTVSSRIYFT